MSFDGAYTATLSPTASESFGSHVLSNSISSLASSTSSRPSTSNISKAYRQASQLFLTRRLPEALSTVLPLITPSTETSDVNGLTEPAPVVRASRSTRIKVWSLYLTILNAILELDPDEGKDAFGTQEWRTLCKKVRDGDVWEEVVQFGYHGIEGEVDSDVVINLATLLLAHAKSQTVNQKRLENYLAASSTPNLDISKQLEATRSPRLSSRSRRSPSKGASGADTPRDLNARVKILELYTLHVLLRNNEWDYAREFISVSAVLDEERRDAFLQALQSLQEDQQESERKEREEKQRQEEQLQKDIEEARRLRAENEARERRRLDEERARREGSEVDYGIDNTQNTPGSRNKTRSVSGGSSLSKPGKSSLSKGKKAVAPPTFSARAAMIIANLRNVIEQMGASFKANPMLLMRLMAFVIGIIITFGRRGIRERIQRILGTGWNKVKATAGMGVKVSYI
ncbi:hypothetical protein F5Y04DRAFT_116664 [Hypomontagnella monticulosa]|nr:hypothetical protein F5Y04DRAFT_116664 [Hypomontagnella monticulosa]